MYNITKKQFWAAILTAATVFSLTGCSTGSDKTSYTEGTMGVVETVAEYSSNTDYLYVKNEDGTIAVSGYVGSDAVISVPDNIDGMTVTAIEDHAFEANWDLTDVTLPEGITYIGESAFMDCGKLESINIPSTTVTIRRAAFASCSALDNVTIPESVAQIMEEAFSGCGSLKNLIIESKSVIYESWGLDSEVMSDLVITCPSGSKISDWANENGFNTEAL